jgi:hypothetical protein
MTLGIFEKRVLYLEAREGSDNLDWVWETVRRGGY